jgi:hypothetical protein
MNFYTRQHNHYCGIDLHAKAMYVGILDQNGIKLVHKNLPTPPQAFLRLIAPYREDLVLHAHAGTSICSPALCDRVTPEGREGACRLTGRQRIEPARCACLTYSLDCEGRSGRKIRSRTV